MYNTDLPRRADLPSSAQLKRSTWIAGITASAILALVILPSEYAIDPTGIGRMLGLTQMGEIKTQLAQEAVRDAAVVSSAQASPQPTGAEPSVAARLDRIETLLQEFASVVPALPAKTPPAVMTDTTTPTVTAAVPSAMQPADERFAAAAEAQPEGTSQWRDEVSFELAPGEGAEIKLVMEQDAQAEFHWTANGGVVNYDTHGDGGGNSISYEKGRSVPEQEGTLSGGTGQHRR